ncbi:MAG: serine/threonine-protein kinase [Myxococcota bacterium]
MRGRYALATPLGFGGLGAVFRAHDVELDREVAVKLLRHRRSTPAQETDRLVREANAMARINNPHVVQVYDVGRYAELSFDDPELCDIPSDGLFVVMELVRGQDLDEWLTKPRSQQAVLDVFVQCARGLSAAHAYGVVHRDFKPANVLLAEDGTAKVTDFGLAAACEATGPSAPSQDTDDREWLGRSLTQTGMTMGTPAYMAPEQHRGYRVDARADQYSFCLALAEAVYGARPVRGDSMAELLRSKLALRLPADAGVPGWLRRVLERGTSEAPDARFRSMEQLTTALLHRKPWPRRAPAFAVGGLVALAMVAWPRADAEADTRATTLVRGSPAPDSGADPAWRNNAVAFPDRPSRGEAQLEGAAALRAELARLMVGGRVDDPDKRLRRVEDAYRRAQSLGDGALMAEAELVRALYMRRPPDSPERGDAMAEAYRLAEAVDHHAVAARAAVGAMAGEEAGTEAWTRWRRRAELHGELGQGDLRATLALSRELGYALHNERDYEAALVQWQRAVRLGVELLGSEHLSVSSDLSMLAMSHKHLGDYDDAEAALRRALAIAKASEHYDTGFEVQTRLSLVDVLARGDGPDAAAAEIQTVLALIEAGDADDEFLQSKRSDTHWRLARLESRRGRYAQAVESYAAAAATMDADFPYNGLALHKAWAEALLELDRKPEAIAALHAGLRFTDPDAPEWEERVEARALLEQLEAS